jgi:hypothetical protein
LIIIIIDGQPTTSVKLNKVELSLAQVPKQQDLQIGLRAQPVTQTPLKIARTLPEAQRAAGHGQAARVRALGARTRQEAERGGQEVAGRLV